MYEVNKNIPPPFVYAEYFERSPDPFNKMTIMSALGYCEEDPCKPETGWMALDWIENPIGFVPDGTMIDADMPTFELEVGYFKDGRIFAYDTTRNNASLKKRHAEYRENGV